MALPTVGCQLIIFGKKYNINEDTDAILDCLAAAGYKAVEGGAKDAESYKRKLAERGLVYGGSHTGMAGLKDIKPLVKYLKTLGASDLCNSGLMKWGEHSLKDWQEGIRVLNEAGRQLRDEGVRLHYHNHAFEFTDKVDGDKNAMDLLLDGLDFSVVDFCVDVAWVKIGGQDPATFLRTHKDRIGYLHFKDHDGETWRELGRGNVDFASIMKVLPELTKVRWVMVEQDTTLGEPMESVRISRQYLKDTFNY